MQRQRHSLAGIPREEHLQHRLQCHAYSPACQTQLPCSEPGALPCNASTECIAVSTKACTVFQTSQLYANHVSVQLLDAYASDVVSLTLSDALTND